MERSSTPRRRLLLRTGNCYAAIDDQRLAVDPGGGVPQQEGDALAVSSGRPLRFLG